MDGSGTARWVERSARQPVWGQSACVPPSPVWRRYRAHVQAVGHDCDLALLSVEDEAFWANPTSIKPLALGPLPALQQVGAR